MKARRAVSGPWRLLQACVAALYLFVFVPILITAFVAFNAANQSKFPPVGFSLRWWNEALTPRWLEPLAFSVQLGALTALCATLLGLPLAYGLTRYRFPGRDLVVALSLGPLALPALVTGIGILQFFQVAGLQELFGFPTLLIGHIVICVPFSVRTIAIGLQAMPAKVELAGASLGARPARVFLEITLPLVRSGVFAGAVFAFVQSFTDYSISLFLSRAGMQPISIAILSSIDYGFTPTLAAVAVMTLVVPLTLIAVVQSLFGIGDFIHGARDGG